MIPIKPFAEWLKDKKREASRTLVRPGTPFQTGKEGPASEVRRLNKNEWKWDEVQGKLVKRVTEAVGDVWKYTEGSGTFHKATPIIGGHFSISPLRDGNYELKHHTKEGGRFSLHRGDLKSVMDHADQHYYDRWSRENYKQGFIHPEHPWAKQAAPLNVFIGKRRLAAKIKKGEF